MQMYALIQFNHQYDEYNICKYNAIERKENKYTVKWNGGSYEVKVIFVETERIIHDLYFNLKNGLPIVVMDNATQYQPRYRRCMKKYATKKHCCIFCKKLVSKIGRHLTTVHKTEPEIVEINSLPAKDSHRTHIIDKLRKFGDFYFNKNILQGNDDSQQIIACRRWQRYKERPRHHYVPCPSCKGMFSKFSLKSHAAKCISGKKRNKLQAESRKVIEDVHPKACPVLKERILPILNTDMIGQIIRKDELIIIFGNKLAQKYRAPHQDDMIRARMRLVGRFLLSMRERDITVTSLQSALKLNKADHIIASIEAIGRIDQLGIKYKSASSAFSLTTYLKNITKILHLEFIKKGDKESAAETDSLLKFMDIEFGSVINTTVKESQLEASRRKTFEIPKTESIKRFLEYLDSKIKEAIAGIETKFSYTTWYDLASYTLISIQVFNRKRPGEAQRLLIEDFNAYSAVNEDQDRDIYNSLSAEDKIQAQKYVRVTIRGKKGRDTGMLLNQLHVKALYLILNHRKETGISPENRFLFGIPSVNKFATLNAYKLMKTFSEQSGIDDHRLFRGNPLRKHVATSVSLNRHDPVSKERLSDFMSHSMQIHKSFYEIKKSVADITDVSKLLEEAGGQTKKTIVEQDTVRSDANESQTEASLSSGKQSTSFDSSGSENESTSSTRSSSPAQVRKSWSTPERRIAREKFGSYIKTGRVPPVSVCRKLINEFSDTFSNTKPTRIQTWVRHQSKLYTRTSENTGRTSWTTPEKRLVKQIFSEKLSKKTAPSIKECAELKLRNPLTLRKRSPQMIKAFVTNEIRRRSKE